jgi:phospholipid/cholesterol/gamma-HCH transport system substrate-binding protein
METRAHHITIGAFVLVFVAAILVFVVWLAKGRLDRDTALYEIVFTDAVSGLAVGGDVRFNGIKVGTVSKFAIDADNPSLVRVTAEIGEDIPIRQDSTASLQMQGITGVSFVQITGGSPSSPRLEPTRIPPHPVIRSRPSQITEIVESLPRLVDRSTQLVDRGNTLLDEQNRGNIAAALVDLRRVTQALADRAQSLGKVIDNLDRASDETVELVRRATRVAEDISATLSVARGALTGVDQLVDSDMREAVASFNQVAKNVSRLFNENKESIDSFAGEGLTEFRRFIEEARVMVQNLGRFATRVEENPSQVFFGRKEAEIKLENERR